MAKIGKHTGSSHTGRIHHTAPMPKAHGKDPLAHESHGKMNKEHGTPGGFSADHYEGGQGEYGGEGMADNCDYD
jgi:hypothetical protein